MQKKLYTKRFLIFSFLLFAGLFYRMFFTVQASHITGQAFGTTYSVKVVLPQIHDPDLVKEKIDFALSSIDDTFSTYNTQSLLSKFNNGQSIPLNHDLSIILEKSDWLYNQSNRAWDPTIQPLFSLWRFDNVFSEKEIPQLIEIKKALSLIGFDNLSIVSDLENLDLVAKKRLSANGIQLDFSSIAKGYAVDKVALLLETLDADSYLVEIGGELRSFGDAPGKKAWRVGINDPNPEASATSVFKVVELKNKALATSGTYRHFFDKNGNRYSHILDPRTGYPVTHNVVSVSVIADDCMTADGLATALLVMGVDDGLKLVASLPEVEAMFLITDNQEPIYSNSFKSFVKH